MHIAYAWRDTSDICTQRDISTPTGGGLRDAAAPRRLEWVQIQIGPDLQYATTQTGDGALEAHGRCVPQYRGDRSTYVCTTYTSGITHVLARSRARACLRD